MFRDVMDPLEDVFYSARESLLHIGRSNLVQKAAGTVPLPTREILLHIGRLHLVQKAAGTCAADVTSPIIKIIYP